MSEEMDLSNVTFQLKKPRQAQGKNIKYKKHTDKLFIAIKQVGIC